MWGLVFAGVSAASGVFSAVEGAISNRSIRDSLDKVINYLKELDSKLNIIQSQNAEILRKLDELPAVIRQIVQEIVDISLLEERYAAIHAIKLNITTLKLDRKYRITEPGWREFSSILTYLFSHENRVSYLFRLILASELALAATRNQARPFIKSLLSEKIGLMEALRDDFINKIESELVILKSLLDNSQFISSNNLSDKLDDWSKLTYIKQPDRMRTVNYTERECRTRIGHCGDEYEICRDIPRSRIEPDTPFHNARDAHVNAIEKQKAIVAALLTQLTNFVGVLVQFQKYLKKIESLHSLHADTIMFFEIGSATAALAAGDDPGWPADEREAYRLYYDDLPDRPANFILSDGHRTVAGIFETVSFRCPVV